MKISTLKSSVFNLTSRARRAERAFTLVEVLVAVSIFAIVMLVATGAVFSIVEANKKTHSLKSVMTNLNFALESMAREIRVGSDYSCNGGGDCLEGGSTFSFQANRDVNGVGGSVPDSSDRIQYSSDDRRIIKTISGVSSVPITASEIRIESLQFYVVGTESGDGKQPKVVMVVRGVAGQGSTASDFHIQTTVSQRAIDS